ncbi:MAG: hypothetical protein U5L08_07270 [Xanthomonadales bacterium]|nr:hypothetical protein [Xanthomonadales bacterium]
MDELDLPGLLWFPLAREGFVSVSMEAVVMKLLRTKAALATIYLMLPGLLFGADCVSGLSGGKESQGESHLKRNVERNPHAVELAEIADELTRVVVRADITEYTNALAAGDLEGARSALGLTKSEVEEFERRLSEARDGLVSDFPEIIEHMPKRSLLDDPGNLAQHFDEFLASPSVLSDVSFISTLQERPRSNVTRKFLDDPPGPEPDPCLNPPCEPGDPPDGPPNEDDEIPPGVDPATDCAYTPYIASLAACTFTGTAGYIPCAIIALCTWCEGGWVHNTCTP